MSGLFSPPPAWYEPLDFEEEVEPAPAPVEPLVIAFGAVIWTDTTDDAELYA